MHQTVNNHADRYARLYPSQYRYFYSCRDCGEVVSDMFVHDLEHRRRETSPIVVFVKMSEIVTILWGENGSG